MLTRKNSKFPNVYKLEIELSHKQYHIDYFSSLNKVDLYLEKYLETNFPTETLRIEMSRIGLNENTIYGTLVDSGKIIDDESGIEFPIKIYKLKIK